jgi:outer membrane protein OmpA-like peptidoglycan-associated protein/opacity protein-like surface antigen
MLRAPLAVLVVALLVATTAFAGGPTACRDKMGVGIRVGGLLPSGGDEQDETAGILAGIQIKQPLTDRVWAAFDYTHGASGHEEFTLASPGLDRLQGWGEADQFATVWNRAELSAIVDLMPDKRSNPFVSAGLGFTFWEVHDWRDEASEAGEVPEGYDTDGRRSKLRGTNLTAVLGAGLEFFAAENLSFTVGGRYHYMFESDLDNVGLSVMSPEHVDANASIMEAYVGLTYYLGPGDCDGDGIIGKKDKCPRKPEDFDGFEDADGCPDVDNDGDGILDVDDACPDDAEDFDGEDDEDGCPDVDRDGDGILDIDDACPDDPEDIDGFEDADGCPDVDNDGDGIPDVDDACPDDAEDMDEFEDEDGCPEEGAPPLPLPIGPVVVQFDLARAELKGDGRATLDQLVLDLQDWPGLPILVVGHACDLGSSEYNQKLSERRAAVVESYLIEKGISADTITTTGRGEEEPFVRNASEEQRRQNRRAVIRPVRD